MQPGGPVWFPKDQLPKGALVAVLSGLPSDGINMIASPPIFSITDPLSQCIPLTPDLVQRLGINAQLVSVPSPYAHLSCGQESRAQSEPGPQSCAVVLSMSYSSYVGLWLWFPWMTLRGTQGGLDNQKESVIVPEVWPGGKGLWVDSCRMSGCLLHYLTCSHFGSQFSCTMALCGPAFLLSIVWASSREDGHSPRAAGGAEAQLFPREAWRKGGLRAMLGWNSWLC